ncbi:MAG: hypothetical protein ACQEQG_08435 [Bacillota bacterium]
MIDIKNRRTILKIIISLFFLLALLVILNYALGTIITSNFRTGLQESLENLEQDIYLTRGSFNTNPFSRNITGEGLELYHPEGHVSIARMDIKMSFFDMLMLIQEDAVHDDILDSRGLQMNMTEVIFADERSRNILSLNQLDLAYDGQADLTEELLSFNLEVNIDRIGLGSAGTSAIESEDNDNILNSLGLDLEKLNLTDFILRVSSNDFFVAEEGRRYEFIVDNLEFDTNLASLESEYDLAYRLDLEELEIYRSEIAVDFKNPRLKQSIEFLAIISGIPFDFREEKMILTPTGFLSDLNW